MAKEKTINVDLSDDNLGMEVSTIQNEAQERKVGQAKVKQKSDEPLISCLRNEIISVRYIKKLNGFITNPKHALYGGMADTAFRTFTVPMLRSGVLINVLTNAEKAFLEDFMGLEDNALSIYRKVDNYWRNYQVRLTKHDTYFNLSNPEDYIKYKVLLANKDFICPDLETLRDKPKQTYQFVIASEAEESKQSTEKMSSVLEAARIFGSIESDKAVLKHIVETMTGRKLSDKSKIADILPLAFKEMEANPKLFISVAKDPYLKTKILVSEAVELGLIRKNGDYYYDKSNMVPICESNEEPTLMSAVKYINSPKRQEFKFGLEARIKQLKD